MKKFFIGYSEYIRNTETVLSGEDLYLYERLLLNVQDQSVKVDSNYEKF